MDKTKIAVDIFNKLAEVYQNKFMDVSSYGETFDLFCDAIKKENAELLELACGPGNISRYLLNKRPDLKLLGTDLALRMLDLARINNPTAEFKLMDCREIASLNKTFDAIMCGFCLPYLTKEKALKLISDASKILNDEGVFYISTMEDDYTKSGLKKGSSGDELFMHYHEANYLLPALIAANFTILQFRRQDYPEKDGSTTTDLILIAQKK